MQMFDSHPVFTVLGQSGSGAAAMTEIRDSSTTSAVIPVLSGGVRYVYTQPLTALTIGWVTENAAVRFTADAAGCAINLPPGFTVPAVAAGSTCELRFSGGAVVQTAVSGPDAAPDPFAVPGAERIGPAVPFTEFSVPTGTGGRAAVWTGETVPPSSSLVFADGITSGGISFGIDSLTIPSGVILTGVPSGTTLAGDLRVHTRNSQLYALIAADSSTVTSVNIEMENTGFTMVVPSRGTVTGGIRTRIRGGSAAGGDIVYGPRVYSTSSGDTGSRFTAGRLTCVLVNGTAPESGSFFVTPMQCIAPAGATDFSCTAGEVSLTVNGGTWGDPENPVLGRGLFGGPFAAVGSASVQSVRITVNGGQVMRLYGAGFAQAGGTSEVDGSIEIIVNGGYCGHIFAGGNPVADSSSVIRVSGDVNIRLNGGTLTGTVHATEMYAGETIEGSVSVILAGNTDFECNLMGVPDGHDTDASARRGTLVMDGYSGTVSGRILGFATIVLRGDTAATLSGQVTNCADTWVFDLTRRRAGFAARPLLTGHLPTAVRVVTPEPAADWPPARVLFAGNQLPANGVEIRLEGADEAVATLTGLDIPISGTNTGCDGWGLTATSAGITFARLSDPEE